MTLAQHHPGIGSVWCGVSLAGSVILRRPIYLTPTLSEDVCTGYLIFSRQAQGASRIFNLSDRGHRVVVGAAFHARIQGVILPNVFSNI